MFALTLIVLVSAALLGPRNVYSIPAFARKYQTSCQTCHVAIPALTPFGEAFRQNGYRFPAGNDAAMTKTPPVSLGAEGYKKLWPQSVWPGEIPGMPPVSILLESTVEYDHATRIVSFASMGGAVEILAAGTLDEHFSFWGGFEFANEAGELVTELGRVNLLVRPLDSPALQFKVGSFEPGLILASNHRSLMDQKLQVLAQAEGDNPWAPEGFQQGLEAYGVLQHRVLYNAGVVEGSGSVGDKSKDVYGRLAYKFGGLPFDGVTSGGAEAALPANPKPWSEKSLAVSGFVYKGEGILTDPTDPPPPPIRDPFQVIGGDLTAIVLDLAARAGYAERKDDRLLAADPTSTDIKIRSQFVELSWVSFPWLVPAGRWESSKVGDEETNRVSFTVNGLARANVRSFLAANWVKEPGGKFTSEGATLGLLLGF
ncbi:MAG: hypothetical protein HZC42_13795 [Candidatus Eisenbacteria bacterium]|nr:hypothetical protein [Candidatus Eisenbacteria bacterium]